MRGCAFLWGGGESAGCHVSLQLPGSTGQLRYARAQIRVPSLNVLVPVAYKRVYPKVSGLAAWSENCKWYSSLPPDAVLSLFYESV
jgi:hypothetical protein